MEKRYFMKINELVKKIFPNHRKDKIPTGEEFKKCQALATHFQEMLKFQKKNKLDHLPFYLLMGPEGSGKTSLLQRANISFQFPKSSNPANEELFQWWATKDLIIIDIPGDYFSPKNFLWEQFLKLAKQHCKQKLAGILLAVHFPELSKSQSSQQKKQIVIESRQRISQLKDICGHTLPVYLIVTKCDLLNGFSEFFSECGSDELAQSWGITIPTLKPQEKLVDVFVQRFNALIKRLNTQLIWRLHQERSSQARPFIKDFPLQIERLKETLASFIKALHLSDTGLTGMYLTSALQLAEKNQQALEVSRGTTSFTYRSYFIRQVFLQGILYRADKQTNKMFHLKEKWQTRLAYSCSFLFIAVAAVFLSNDFEQSVQQAYSIQNDLTKYQLAMQQGETDKLLLKSLPLLDSLHEAAFDSNYRLTHPIAYYSKKSQQTANEIYTEALHTILLSEIKSIFEKYLLSQREKNPNQLYSVLSAYLMLGNQQAIDTSFFENTLNSLIPNKVTKLELKRLFAHIELALNSPTQPFELNNELINQTRKELWALPKIDLGMIIIKNLYKNNIDSMLKLGTQPASTFISRDVANQIPNMFTASCLTPILQQEIMQAATEVKKGNTVLGKNDITVTPEEINNLAMELRDRYIANYIDVWESLLENIKLFHATDLTELDAMILNLTGDHSPLLQLLQTVEENTKFPVLEAASPKLQAMNHLLVNPNNAEQNPLFKIFVSLRQVHEYLQNVSKIPGEGKGSLEIIKLHTQLGYHDPLSQLRTIAEQSPEPMRSWLTTISQQCWTILAKQAIDHINEQWKQQVLSYYQKNIFARYPFNARAHQEVDLNHLTEFFGQPGIFNQFIQTYLKPFIDDSGKQWRWKLVENSKLPFSDNTLQQIKRASHIQHMFFPNGDNKLFVQFTLEPVGMDASLKNAKISMNGQDVAFQQAGPATPRILSWPGENLLHSTALTFTSPSNQPYISTLKSEWGWFKLVNQSTEQIISPKKLLLTLNVSGHIAKYYLYSENKLNPFIIENLDGFELNDLI